MLKKRYYIGDLLFEPVDGVYDIVINYINDIDILMLYTSLDGLNTMYFVLKGYLDV